MVACTSVDVGLEPSHAGLDAITPDLHKSCV